MRHVEVNGKRLSVIGLGTWQFGSKDWGYGSEYADVEAGRILQRALDLGVNVIDTAEIYGRGNSERIVGQGARRPAQGSVRRDEGVPGRARPRGWVENHGAQERGPPRHRRHRPVPGPLAEPVVPIGQQMEGMRRLQQAHVIIDAGVSNFSLDRWRAAEHALGSPVLSNQVQYSLVARKPDAELVPYAQAQRPPRDRVQPARHGDAVGPLHADQPAYGLGAPQQSVVPSREPRPRARR